MSSDALSSAVSWLTGMMLGSIATSIGLLAVAGLGFAMMQGRIPARRAVGVILGCFILASASTIADGLLNVTPPPPEIATLRSAPTPAYTPSYSRPAPYDPYAGAAVPVRQQALPEELVR